MEQETKELKSEDNKSNSLITTELIYSRAGLEICASPFLCGEEIVKHSQECSSDFLKSLAQKSAMDDPVLLDILMGGRHYHLNKVWPEVFPHKSLAHAEIRASRFLADDGNWGVKIWYDKEASVANQDSPDPFEHTKELLRTAKTLIIGDTLATGTTMRGILGWVLDQRKDSPHGLNVEIFSIAGSDKCLDQISKLTKRFKEQQWRVRIWFANQSFYLNDNGTDLEFIGARMLPVAKEYYNKRLGDFQSKMKCGIWDWGDRCSRVESHLEEIHEYYHTQKNVPKFITSGIEAARALCKT